jgi:hypothetical protein
MELISPVATSFRVPGFIKLLARRNEKNGSIQFIRSIITPNFRYIESGNENRCRIIKSGRETDEREAGSSS